MAARLEELALRSSDFGEAQYLRNFAKTYELVALEHRNYLDNPPEVKVV